MQLRMILLVIVGFVIIKPSGLPCIIRKAPAELNLSFSGLAIYTIPRLIRVFISTKTGAFINVVLPTYVP
jgi:hypothetical protein